MEFKDKLKELRLANGLTQEALAYQLKVSRSTIAKWEAGLGMPLDYSIEELCKVFNCTKDELFPNKTSEILLVNKNIKINKKNILIGTLITLLFLVILIVSISFTSKTVKKNNIDKHIPKCSEFTLYEKNGYPITNEYCLQVNEFYQFSFIIQYNQKVFDYYRGIELRISDYGVYLLKENIHHISNDNIYIKYEGEVLIKYEKDEVIIDKLNVEYSFDGEQIIKKCNIENTTIKVKSVIPDEISVEFKVGNQVIDKILCKKGDKLNWIFNANEMDTKVYNYLRSLGIYDYISIDYYDGENEKYLTEHLLDNTTIDINVDLIDSYVPDIKVVDEGNFLYWLNTIKYIEVNGNRTTSFDYKILNGSDNLKIHSDELYEILFPGNSYLLIECDLGFYKGIIKFNFEVSDITRISIRSTQMMDSVEARYNHETKELELDENGLNRIISRYEWENQKYLEKGVIRKFIRFEKLSNIDYQPIFEYDKEIEVPDIYIYVNGQKYNLKYLNKTIEVKRNTDVIEDFRYKHSGNYGHIGYTVVCDNEIGYRGNRFYKEGEFEINLYFVIHLDGVDYHLDPFKIKFKVC